MAHLKMLPPVVSCSGYECHYYYDCDCYYLYVVAIKTLRILYLIHLCVPKIYGGFYTCMCIYMSIDNWVCVLSVPFSECPEYTPPSKTLMP